jgi:hypothetical protein
MTATPSTFISHSVDKALNRTAIADSIVAGGRSDRQNWNLILYPTALQTI